MFHFLLVSLSGVKYDGPVYEVNLPTLDGQIGILANHMPLTGVAKNGVIIVKPKANLPDNMCEYFAISGGALDFDQPNNSLRLLVDEADRPDEINEVEVQKALSLAKQMKAEAKDQISLEHAQTLVDRQEVRLQLANLKRHSQRIKR